MEHPQGHWLCESLGPITYTSIPYRRESKMVHNPRAGFDCRLRGRVCE
jgi:hypothetical protein